MRSWRSSSQSRAISSRPISSRASRSWWRTRNCRKPSVLRNASAASTWRSLSAVMRSPYCKREDRHANEGLSQVGNPSSRERSRISCLVSPASIMGARTPRCFADCMPGRWSPRSSTLAPYTSARHPSRSAIGARCVNSSSLQKKHRLAPFFAYSGLASSSVRTIRCRRPISPASRRASSISPAGYVSESAVTSSARSPSASFAARASSVESTPPENATTTLSSWYRTSTRRSYLARVMRSIPLLRLDSDQVVERRVTLADLGGREPRQPLEREVLDRERCHHRAVDDRPSHRGGVDPVLRGEVTHEPARERVAGARRVVDRLQRVRRNEEQPAFGHQERAVLTALDDDGLRPHRGDGPRGADEIRLAGELPGLPVVDRHHVHFGEHAAQRVALALDPEVHGVQRDEPWALLHLTEHVELELGVDVRQEQIGHPPQPVGEHRPELGEDVELRLEGLRLVQVVSVLAGPAQGAALGSLEPGDVHAAVLEEPQMRLREVLADGRDQVHRSEEARRVGEVGRRATERLVHLAEGRLDAVQRDGADDQEISHAFVRPAWIEGGPRQVRDGSGRPESTCRGRAPVFFVSRAGRFSGW